MLDREISNRIEDVTKSFMYVLINYKHIKKAKRLSHEFNLAGSVSENGFSSRMFHIVSNNADDNNNYNNNNNNNNYNNNSNNNNNNTWNLDHQLSSKDVGDDKNIWDLEADIESVFMEIGVGYRHCIHDIPSKKGFLRINLRQNGCSNQKMFRVDSTTTNVKYRWLKHEKLTNFSNSEDGYLMTYRLKDNLLYDKFELHRPEKAHFIKTNIKTIISFALSIPHNKFILSNIYRYKTKATCKAGFNVAYLNKNFSLSTDFAIIIRLQWKPAHQVAWETRPKNWPVNTTDIFRYYTGYVIAKPSSEDKHNQRTTEFRYSFGLIERKLASMQSDQQRRTYLIFKSLYYKIIAPLNKDIMTSYLAKTIMMWTCEQFPPHDKTFWNTTKQGIRNTVIYLFTKLEKACRTSHLPYYFIPDINLLDSRNLAGNLTTAQKTELLQKVI